MWRAVYGVLESDFFVAIVTFALGVGSALFGLGLSSFMSVPPLVGATGAILGVGLAFAFAWPEAELVLFPFPLRITARTLILLLGGIDLFVALWAPGGVAHLAYLGDCSQFIHASPLPKAAGDGLISVGEAFRPPSELGVQHAGPMAPKPRPGSMAT